MVFLSRIYTKSGDDGTTGLGDGSRVAKDHARVTAYGDVDELNSQLGIVHTLLTQESVEAALILHIQNDLFDVGADLCVPITEGETKMLRITVEQVEYLEREIDRINEHLQPLRSFILPGGTPASAQIHLARTICRRAERSVVTLFGIDPINKQAMIYLNRLSDLLFVLARYLNNQGQQDILWVPGQSRGKEKPN